MKADTAICDCGAKVWRRKIGATILDWPWLDAAGVEHVGGSHSGKRRVANEPCPLVGGDFGTGHL